MRKCLIWVLLVSVLVIGGIACAQAAPPAPTVTILPENPTSTSDIIVRYDKVYDEVRFKMIQNGEIISGGQDTLTDTDFDWGYMEAGEWQIDAQARVGDEWGEHF